MILSHKELTKSYQSFISLFCGDQKNNFQDKAIMVWAGEFKVRVMSKSLAVSMTQVIYQTCHLNNEKSWEYVYRIQSPEMKNPIWLPGNHFENDATENQ